MHCCSSKENPPPGPSRESLSEDICYYFTHYSMMLQNELHDPSIAAIFLKKIIACYWLQLITYGTSLLASHEYPLSRRRDLTGIQIPWVEGRWSDLQMLSRRCGGYCDDIEVALISLGIPFKDPDTTPANWNDCDRDFQFIYKRLSTMKTRADLLNTSITGLAGIAGNRQALKEAKRSLREAKSVKTLTLIATVFIPLAFTSGLFSMSERYIPGADRFWVYISVSGPLVVLVIILTILFDLGFDEDGSWSITTFTKVAKLRKTSTDSADTNIATLRGKEHRHANTPDNNRHVMVESKDRRGRSKFRAWMC